LVAKMLNLPVYLRGSTYYLHTRVYGKQVKRSLGTSDKKTAMILAGQFLSALVPMTLKKYEIDIGRGILKSDGPEDHRMMMDALESLGKLNHRSPHPQPPGEPLKEPVGLRLPEVVDKFFQLKKQLKPATVLAYKNTSNEFAGFINNPIVSEIGISDITRYQEHLAKFNSTRTIDNKIGVLTSVFNFAKTQGYYFKDNPAAGRKLMTNKQREQSGFDIFEPEEIRKIFGDEFKIWKKKDPDFYYCCLLGVVSGCRISEITGLLKENLRPNPVPHVKIKDSKTAAGVRSVPIPGEFFEELREFAKYKTEKQQIFKYKIRLGKGSGNAVGQKFGRHLDKVGIENDQLVFHSLRKFFNDYCMKNKVAFEPRCQIMGHEIDNVNVGTYTNKFSLEEVSEIFTPVQKRILNLIF
jgi:integrase